MCGFGREICGFATGNECVLPADVHYESWWINVMFFSNNWALFVMLLKVRKHDLCYFTVVLGHARDMCSQHAASASAIQDSLLHSMQGRRVLSMQLAPALSRAACHIACNTSYSNTNGVTTNPGSKLTDTQKQHTALRSPPVTPGNLLPDWLVSRS